MSCIKLIIADQEATRSGEVHGSIGDAAIAALSAEPETFHELELALARFSKPFLSSSPLAQLHCGEDYEPYDAGIVIIDLAGRVIMIDSTYSAPPSPIVDEPIDDIGEDFEFVAEEETFWRSDERDAVEVNHDEAAAKRNVPPTYGIRYHDGDKLTDIELPFRLAEDWLFVDSVPEYKGVCKARRDGRAKIEWFDPRPVLYGKALCKFLARDILAAPDLEAENLFTEIHAKWLTTAREDLKGKSPREICWKGRV
jgi:hypothetical protein